MSTILQDGLMYPKEVFNWNTGHPVTTTEFYISSLNIRVNLAGECGVDKPDPKYIKNSITVHFPIDLAEKVNQYHKHISELSKKQPSAIFLDPNDFMPLLIDLRSDLKSFKDTFEKSSK